MCICIGKDFWDLLAKIKGKRVPEAFVNTKNSGVSQNEGSRDNTGIMSWGTWGQWGKGIALGRDPKKKKLPCGLNKIGNERGG